MPDVNTTAGENAIDYTKICGALAQVCKNFFKSMVENQAKTMSEVKGAKLGKTSFDLLRN